MTSPVAFGAPLPVSLVVGAHRGRRSPARRLSAASTVAFNSTFSEGAMPSLLYLPIPFLI